MKTYTQSSGNHAAVVEDVTAIEGLTGAKVYVRLGRFVSAIKHLERANPWMKREHAKSIIDSFHFSLSTPDDEDEIDFSTRGC